MPAPPLPPHCPRPRGSCAPGLSGQRGSRRRAAATECELRRAGSARRASRLTRKLRRPRAPVHYSHSITVLCRPRCCCCYLLILYVATRSARTSHYLSSRSGSLPVVVGRAPAPRGVWTRRGARRRCVAQVAMPHFRACSALPAATWRSPPRPLNSEATSGSPSSPLTPRPARRRVCRARSGAARSRLDAFAERDLEQRGHDSTRLPSAIWSSEVTPMHRASAGTAPRPAPHAGE